MAGNEPAFPRNSNTYDFAQTGLTKREWFAGMSLIGRRANPHLDQNFEASDCFGDADAMIAESKKTPDSSKGKTP